MRLPDTVSGKRNPASASSRRTIASRICVRGQIAPSLELLDQPFVAQPLQSGGCGNAAGFERAGDPGLAKDQPGRKAASEQMFAQHVVDDLVKRPSVGLWRSGRHQRASCRGLDRVDEIHDRGAGRLVAMVILHLADDLEAMQHENSIGQSDHLGHIGSDQQHRDAVTRDAGDQLVNFDFRLDVDSNRGLIDDEDVSLRGQPFRDRDFLLVSARKGRDHRADRRRADRQPSNEWGRRFRLGAGRDQPEKSGDAPPDRDRDVVPDRIGEQQAFALAVLAHVTDAIPFERVVHRTYVRPLSVDTDLAGGDAAEAKDGCARARSDRPLQDHRVRGSRPCKGSSRRRGVRTKSRPP